MFEMSLKSAIFIIFHLSLLGEQIKASTSEKIVFESEEVGIESAPWQVSVRLKAYDMEYYGGGHICGGSVISQRVVLSAAHCIVNEELSAGTSLDNEDLVVYRSPDEFLLIMGSESLLQISRYTLQYQVLQLAIHPAFNFETLVNDIVMFFLNGYIPWNWPTVRAIPLNIAPTIKGILCSTTGWNITEDNVRDQLRGTLVPIAEHEICNSVYGDLTNDLICAGYEENVEHTFCNGDAGGPLVCLGHLAGIILEGNSCAQSGYPGLYVNVLYHYNWIVTNNKTFNYNHYNEAMEKYFVYHQSVEDYSFSGGNTNYIGMLRILISCLILGIYLK